MPTASYLERGTLNRWPDGPRPLWEVTLKIFAAAAGCALLAGATVPADAQTSHHGGWPRGAGGSSGQIAPGQVAPGPSPAGPQTGFDRNGRTPGFAARDAFPGRPDHHGVHRRPFVFYGAGFGLGLAAGLSAYDPWFYGFYDAPFPYYGAYVFSPYPPPGYYGPPPPGAPPIAPPSAYQGGEGAEPSTPAACGSWVWDTAKQVYNWSPCASAPPA